MKLCDETATVFNAKTDNATGMDTYFPTVINGVLWRGTTVSSVDSSGLKAADKITILIPEDADFGGKAYVEPELFSDCDPEKAFTLGSGDFIAKGVVNEKEIRPSELKQRYCTAVILGVSDNRRGRFARHWEVTGA